MRWLIIEDSLESRNGHWFEYLEGFCREMPKLGDDATLLVSNRAEPFVRTQLDARPVLPDSAFLKMSDGAPPLLRYARVFTHAWKTFWAVRSELRANSDADLLFVPTVIVHHLLAWTALVKWSQTGKRARVLLFFPWLPLRISPNGAATLDGSVSARLLRWLLRFMEPEIRAGNVILGVETRAMQSAAEQSIRLPFTYFPHPVRPCAAGSVHGHQEPFITMACYGPARYEKGSDLLALAIETYLQRFPKSRARFVLQWLRDFATPSGEVAQLPTGLRKNPRVEIIKRLFEDGEYGLRLAATQVLLLPYRCSSYDLRVSRVAIEAMVNGIPIVAARGSTLAEQAEEFGAAVMCDDNDLESLVRAIGTVERNYDTLAARARDRKTVADEHFSIQKFRDTLV